MTSPGDDRPQRAWGAADMPALRKAEVKSLGNARRASDGSARRQAEENK